MVKCNEVKRPLHCENRAELVLILQSANVLLK